VPIDPEISNKNRDLIEKVSVDPDYLKALKTVAKEEIRP
jgi:hypothetical protein